MMATSIKEHGAQQALRVIIRLLPRISSDNLIRLTTLGKWLTDDLEVLRAIDKVRQLLLTPGHPAKELFRRVLTYLPPQRRIRLFETLFNGAWFKGGMLMRNLASIPTLP